VNAAVGNQLHQLAAADMLELVRRRLGALRLGDEDLRIGPFPQAVNARVRHMFPASPRPAAVLVPLIDRGNDLTVLLTYRAADLEHHAGQISFPGGRLEPDDVDAESGALREAEEEIGLAREFVEVIGRLPDHIVISGYQVTPVVGLVRPGFTLKLDPTEVAATFEAPLKHLFDPSTHHPRTFRMGQEVIEGFDLPWQEHKIWGATAGMLLTLRQVLEG
jgi:8-oxo-dGTP pyrophosphatase MutT (NUDIX family)